MIVSIKRLLIALAFAVPVAALVAPPAMAKQATKTEAQAQKPKASKTQAKSKTKKSGTQKAKAKTKKPATTTG